MRNVLRNEIRTPKPLDGELDLGGVGRAIVRKRRLIASVTIAALLASVAFVALVKPRYTGEVKLLVENRDTYSSRPDRATTDAPSVAPDAEAIASQIQLVTSRDLAREAIRSLGLRGDPEFDPLAGPVNIFSRIGMLLATPRQSADVTPEDRILDPFYDHMNVFSVAKSRVLQIEFTSSDPDLAARGANTIASLYLSSQGKVKRSTAGQAAASLAPVVSELRGRVSKAEAAAEEYRASNGLMMGANNLNMTNQQLADLSGQLAAARNAQADAQAKSKMLREMLRGNRLGEVSDVGNNELIRRLSEQRATLRAQIASELKTYLPGHPRIKELSAQAGELEGQIRSATEQTARALENDAKVTGARVDNLQTAIGQQTSAIGGASGGEARARELDREARLLKDQLEAVTAKYQDALALESLSSTPSDARIISRAIPPQLPSFPKKLPIVVFGTLAGLVLSIGSVLAGELLSGRAYARRDERDEEVETTDTPGGPEPLPPGRRIAHVRPGNETSTDRQAAARPPSNRVSALAERIETAMGQDLATHVLVTSLLGVAERGQAAVALGHVLGRERRAVLVSLDAVAGDDSRRGIADLIAGHADFDEIIYREPGERLHRISAGQGPISGGDMLDLVLAALSETYDVILLCAAPQSELIGKIAPVADYAVIATTSAEGDAETESLTGDLVLAGVPHVLLLDSTEHEEEQRRAA